ncbi:vanin-like protein 2 isoform X1 [Aethina tumida]|uniref:vanin-like protein 2 isoform X1 n=1 Tax=Aethina tumida TaxID=116153 RepID=UPI0021484277|nr:vanin-like protein 2 isoform X1 [Aethina tumida]
MYFIQTLLFYMFFFNNHITLNNCYDGVVVQYYPYESEAGSERIRTNINGYRRELEELKTKNIGASIVVFPEYGLTGKTAEPEIYSMELPENWNDKNLYLDNIFKLSALAEEHDVYLVVNLLEMAKQKENNNVDYFNTNVVFDRKGYIIKTYRKINLGEKETNLTAGNEVSSFSTDFGVKFGLITNEDLFSVNPSESILQDEAIKDVIAPMSWENHFPFEISTSIQSGYAKANNINVLASSLSKPVLKISGGGFYGTYSTSWISGFNSTKSVNFQSDKVGNLSSFVGKAGRALPNEDTLKPLNITNNIKNYVNNIHTDEFGMDSKKVELNLNEGATCIGEVDYTDNSDQDIFIRASLLNTTKQIGRKTFKIATCLIYMCDSEDIETCGNRLDKYPNLKYNKLRLVLEFTKNQQTDIQRPLTYTNDLKPIENYSFVNNGTNQWIIEASNLNEAVLVFGIETRTEIVNELNPNSAPRINVTLFCLAVMLIIIKVVN